MTTTEPTLADDSVRFPSLESLRATHTELLKEFRTIGGTAEINKKIEAFIRRGKATGALLDADADRWAAQSQLDYWVTQLYRPDYEPPDAMLDEFDPLLAPELEDELCPYVGLDAFRESNKSDFFGREYLVGELVRKLKNVRFLAVLGSSGSGKSSVVRAGLVPALKKGALLGSAEWKYFPPMVPGSNPLTNLARLMIPPDVNPTQAEVEADLYRQNPAYLAEVVSKRFRDNVALVVDQFEEIFTLCTDEVARQRFVDNLIGLCQAPAAEHRVIITMRSDFEANIARLPELQAMFEQAAVRVTPLSASELREAIEAPAVRIGLKFEEGVVDELLNKTLGEPAALPLLQFTLLKLWEHRERNRITWEAYRQLGGGHQALARSADEFYSQLIPEEKVTMRRMLLKMVRFTEGLEVTSNRVRHAALYEKSEAKDRIDRVLERLIQVRLVRVSEGDISADEQVEVAHEALVRNWPRLLEWLDEERVTLRQRQRLTTAAEEWQRLGRDASALWRGLVLEQARAYDDLNDQETEFLEASYEAEQTEFNKLQERAAQLRRLALFLTVALIVTSIAVVVATVSGTRALAGAKISRSNELAAQSISRRDGDFRASLLLGVEAFKTLDTVQTRGALLDNAQANPQLQAYLSGYKDSVYSVAFSPDGKTLASGGGDGLLLLWDVETRRPIGEPLSRHTGSINSVVFSPDGKTLASGSDDHTIILWDVETGRTIGEPLQRHTDGVTSVAFSPDGKTLATGDADGVIILWDVETGQPIGEPLSMHNASINSVAFSPDGKTLASGGGDGFLILWEVETGQLMGQPLGGQSSSESSGSSVNSVAFSPDGKTLVSGGEGTDSTLILWDLEHNEPISQPLRGHTGSVNSVAFSPDGKTLALSSYERAIILWNVETEQPIGQPLRGHTGSVNSVAFSPDGKTLVSGGDDRALILWDVEGKQLISQPLSGPADYIRSTAFSPDGNTLVAGGWNNTLILWDVKGNQPIRQLLSRNTVFVSSVAFSPDGETLVSGGENGLLILWDVETMQPIGQPLSGHTHWVSSVAFSPDGKTLVSGSYDNTIILWDMGTGQPIGEPLSRHTNWVRSVAFSPDGKTLASGSDDHTIILWDVETMQPIGQPLSGHTDWVRSVAFSPDGRTLVSAGDDLTIILWDVETGKPIGQPLSGHTDYIRTIEFSPDGKILASGGDDRTIILWDIKTGQPIGQPLSGHTSSVNSVAFSPDGRTLVSGGGDTISTIILWDIDPASWIQKSCQRAGRNFTRAEWDYYFPNEEYRKTCGPWPLETEPGATRSSTP